MININLISCSLFFLLLFPVLSRAKEIKLVSSANAKHTYSVSPSPDIRYTWKVSGGTILSGQNSSTIIVKGSLPPMEVTVLETPVFKNEIVRPEDFGAKGNDQQDDTKQVQNAIDELKKGGGGTLQFASGQKYIIKSIVVYEGIQLLGNNTTLTRPDNMPNWTRMISSDGSETYEGDSKPIRISGLILDGNAGHQGEFRKFELQQSHLMFFAAGMKKKGSSRTGRVKVFVENCQLKNGVGDGISQYVNSDLTVRNCTAQNLFRGGYVCTGGNAIAVIKKFSTQATNILTGIDVEVDGAGYNDNYKCNIWIDSSVIYDGDFELTMKPGSLVVVSNTKILKPPVTIEMPGSTILFQNCVINFSTNNRVEGQNFILFPERIFFIGCKLVLNFVEKTCIGTCLFIRNNSGNVKNKELNLHLENCNFTVANKPGDKKCYGLAFFRDGFTENHLNIYSSKTTFSKDFDIDFAFAYLNHEGYCRSGFQKYAINNSSTSVVPYQDFYAIFGKVLHP